MTTLEGLRLAGALGGVLLNGEGGPLVMVERLKAHTAPRVAVLGRQEADLTAPLAAWEAGDGSLGLVALLPLPGTNLRSALQREARRIGALVAALDVGLDLLPGGPHLIRRLPGRLKGDPGGLPPLELSGLQAFELARHQGGLPAWATDDRHWWEGRSPEGMEVVEVPLPLPTATPLTEALRSALRSTTSAPVDFLPVPADPEALHALGQLTRDRTAFRAGEAAWREAFGRLARLPAPAHFCARC